MDTMQIASLGAILLFLIVLLAAVAWLATRVSGANSANNQAIANLGGKLDAIQSQVAGSLEAGNQQIAGMAGKLQAIQTQVDSSLQSVTKQVSTFGEVKETLGLVTAATNRVAELGKDITNLQSILQSGLKRGGFGEILLGNLLAQILPEKFYQMQYSFSDRERVDAVVFLGDRILPIDSKFPLEGFGAEGTSKPAFVRSVKGRIDETAKYIRPAEHTLEFAMLYVPAENIYYDIITNADLFNYAMQKKVIAVSPNSMFAYLQVVVYGLRGLEIEEHARMILERLGSVQLALAQVDDQYCRLGTHITQAQKSHAELGKKFDKVTDQLEDLASVTLPQGEDVKALAELGGEGGSAPEA
jgi:DNA recombination protein RmuC